MIRSIQALLFIIFTCMPFQQLKAVSYYQIESDVLLEQGVILNSLYLFDDAIQILSKSIKINPDNRNAYIERALAYFEKNKINLALEDYEAAKRITVPPFASICRRGIYIPENKTDFCKGLISGTIDGAKISTEEFIPSIYSSCRGILNGLWAFACSPCEVSQEMINSAYAMGEFLNSHSTEECLQCVVPELKEIALTWNKIDEISRGQKIGYIIGKYGVDIFAPLGTMKGLAKFRALKSANTIQTLEICAASKVKQAKILEESAKRAVLRDTMVTTSLKNGKILIKFPNVQYHVMQPKHAWDKLLTLSGNVEEDFRKVVNVLENNQIIDKKYLKESFGFPLETSVKKIIRTDYEVNVSGHLVQAVFETYVETGECYLKDAWVITR